MTFSASTYQNVYLAADSTEVHAVVTVDATGEQMVAASAEKAIVFLVDTSGSMREPASKIRAARQAAATAISLLPDGTLFAVIQGTDIAELAYPPAHFGPELARADDRTRAEATEVVRQFQPNGGTAMSTWIDLAQTLVEPHPGAIRLGYLVTDGKNESEPPEALDEALARAAGLIQIDARGVGAKWEVNELRKISSALLGEVDIIKKPDEMDDDFRAFLERAIGKSIADVRLRVWTPQGSKTRFVRQVAPAVEDLTGKAVVVNPLTSDYPTGAWAGGESRDYHVCVDVPPAKVGEERLAARVSLVIDDQVVTQSLVKAIWTDDEALSTRISPQVAHYTGQAELAQVIQEGLEARKAGDDATATVKLGRAVQLATASGNEGTVKLLRRVVEVDDPATGTVRLKRDVEAVDEMELDTRSTRTVRVTPTPPAAS
jgi:hypothetical protein